METKFKVYKNPNIDTSKVASRYKRDNPLFQNSDPTLNNVVQMQQNEKPTEQEQEVSSTPYLLEKLLPDVVTNSDTYQAIHRGVDTVGDVGLDLVKGIFKFFEGIGDFVGTGAAAVGDAFGADTNDLRELIKKDLSEKLMNSKFFNIGIDPYGHIAGKYEEKSPTQLIRESSYLNEAPENIQQGVHGIAQSIGEMLPSIVIGNYAGAAGAGKAAAEAIQLIAFGFGAAGNASEQALNEGATSGQALGYGALSGATEVLTEKLFDGLNLFGGGVADRFLAKTGKPVKVVANLLGEGVEEVLSDLAAPEWKKIVGMADTYQENAPNIAELAESFALGSITSMIMGGASVASSIARYSKDGAKLVSLNQDVSEINDVLKDEIDRVIKDRVTKEQWNELQNDSQAYNNLVAEVIDELNALKQGNNGVLPRLYRNIQSLIEAKNKIIDKMNNLLNNMSEEKIKKVSKIKIGTTTNEKNEKVDYTLGEDILANTIDISDINNHNVTLDKGVNVVGKGTISNNQVTVDKASVQNLTNSQKVQANRITRAINLINSKFGTNYDVVFTDGLTGGKDVNLNGANNKGTFYININSKKALLKTTMHELTHTLENTTMHDELLKFTKDTLGEEAFRKAMEAKKASYTELNQGDNKTLEQEVVADTIGNMFDTYEDVKKLVNANESLAKKIKNWIAKKFNQSKGDTALRKELKPAYEMLNKALGEKNPQSSEQNVSNLSGLTIVGNSAIRFDAQDLRKANDDKETFINNAVDTLYNIEKKGKYRETKAAIRERIEKYFNDMIDVAAIMDDYGISYSPSTIGTAIKPNGDYIYSLDLSTICAKRLQMQEVWDEIVRKNPKAFNDPRSFFKLLEEMHKEGLTTPCGICFVESRRKLLGEMTTKFLNCKNAKIENKSSNKYKAQQEILKYEEQTKQTLTANKLLDSTSLEEIRENFPSLYSIYNTFYGAIKPKLSEKPTSFKFGVIKSLFTDKNRNINHKLVEEVNNHGGFRMLSFSDFQVEHAIDFMQAILECDSLGLKVQAYTKVPEFAKLVKGTNIKLNLSLVLMQDKNGNFNFSSKEGMDVEIAKMLRELDANIGTIVVGPDVLTSLKLIGLDYIDYIIPFHRSSISMTAKNGQVSESHRLGLTGYADFTNYQNEKIGVLGKNKTPENVPQESYWSYNVSGNENSKRYIEYCVKNNIKPKFYDVFLAPTLRDSKTGKPSKKGVSFEYFLNQNGIKYEKFSYKKYEFIIPDGYWKSLGDYRNYDNNGKAVPQVPVKANFDKATWEDLLKNYKSPRLKMANGTYVSEGELTTIENKVVDQFLEDVKNNNLNSDLYGKPLSDSSNSNKVKYSIETDSNGNKLSEQQVEFFKDSKVRDESGKLLVVYHGTQSDFNVYDRSKLGKTTQSDDAKLGFHFTDNHDLANIFSKLYSDDLIYKVMDEVTNELGYDDVNEIEKRLQAFASKNGKIKEQYLNIKNPLDFSVGKNSTSFSDLGYAINYALEGKKELVSNDEEIKSFEDIGNIVKSNFDGEIQTIKSQLATTKGAIDRLKELGYDGLILPMASTDAATLANEYDKDKNINLKGKEYVTFESNQVKNIDNYNPSSSNDIRYSVSDVATTDTTETVNAEATRTRERGIEDTRDIPSNYVRGRANYLNDEVYQKKTASKLFDNTLSAIFKEKNPKISGGKDKIINYIFQELNKTKLEDITSGNATDSMANKIADYIVTHIDKKVTTADKATLVSDLATSIQEAYLNEGKIAGYKAMKEKLLTKIAELKKQLYWNIRLVKETRKMSRAIDTFKKTTNRNYSNNPSAKPLDKMFTQAVDILKKLRLTNFYTQEARSIMKEYRDVFYNKDNEMLKDDYSQMIVDMIDSIVDGSGNLDVYEMNTLVNIYQSLNKLMKYYDNVVFEDRVEKATEIATNLQNDIASGRKINKNISSTAVNAIQKPRLVLRQFDGSSGDTDNSLTNLVYGELRQAEDKFKKNYTSFLEKLLDFEKKHKKFKKRMFKQTVEINGKKIPLGEAITIYQWSRREQARKHFMKDVNPSAQGINIYSQKNGNFLGTFTLTQEDIDKLHDSFDNETLEYINFIDGLIEDAKVLKEETDYKALGFTNAVEDFYFPIMTDKMYNAYKNFGDVRNVQAIDSVLGLSANQNIVANANNKLRLENAYDIVNRHINQMSKYNAYYVTIKAIQKSMNTYTENKTTAKQSLIEANPDIVDYIDNLVIDVADVRQPETKFGERISSFLRGNLAIANLGLNLKVIFNQLSSIPTALSILSPRSLIKSYKMGIGKNAATEMDKYCRYTYYRHFNNTKVMSEIYRSDSNTIIDEGFSTIREGYHKVQNLVMQPISRMDRRAMVRLWNACQVEVESKYGLKIGTEENKVKAGELLEKVVRETQPDYSPLESPQIKKSRSELVRWMTMFTTQPLQNLNQIIEASNDIRNIREQIKKNGSNEELNAKLSLAKKKLARNAASVMAANLMYTLIALGFKELLGKRKEDEGIAEEFIKDFIGTNVGMIPIVREIYNKLFNNYDLSADPLGAVNDFIDATKSIYNNVDSGNYQGLWYKLSKALSTLTGIPFKNINEYSMALIGAFSPSTAYKYRSIWYNKTVSEFTNDLEKAITKKDDSQINAIIQALYSKKGINLTDSNIKELNSLSYSSTKPLITLKSVTSSTVINGEQVEINDTSKVKKYYSENVNASLNSLIKNAYYAGLSKEEKAYAIKLSNDAAFYKALTTVLKTDIKENKINLLTKAFSGNTYYTMIAALAKCKNSLKGDKVKIQKYINSLRLSKQQKYILYGLAGYKPLNENAATQVSNYLTIKGYDKEMREYIMDFAKLI